LVAALVSVSVKVALTVVTPAPDALTVTVDDLHAVDRFTHFGTRTLSAASVFTYAAVYAPERLNGGTSKDIPAGRVCAPIGVKRSTP